VRKKRRLVAECLDATEPAGPPAEGTTEEPRTIVDSVAREPVIKCHQVEEFLFPRMWWGSEVSG